MALPSIYQKIRDIREAVKTGKEEEVVKALKKPLKEEPKKKTKTAPLLSSTQQKIKSTIEKLKSIPSQTSQVDPEKQYELTESYGDLEEGQVVSGSSLQKEIIKQTLSQPTQTTPKSKYITINNKIYELPPETADIYESASPEQKQNIISSLQAKKPAGFVGPSAPSASPQAQFQEAYESMSPAEKAEYNKKYILPNIENPEEIKYYEGGLEYLQSLSEPERQALINKYLEQNPDLQTSQAVRQRDVTSILFPQSPSDIPDGTSYQPRSARTERETAWDLITTPEQQLQEKYYSQLGTYPKAVLGYSRGVTSTLASPITLPQVIFKTATGKQLGPDTSKYLSMQPGATSGPQGLIGATISEGVGLVTGKSPGEYAKIQKSPIEALASTGGEIVGMATLSGLGQGAKSITTKRVIKPTIRYTPKVLTKFKSFTGRNIPFYSKLSKSKTIRQIYKWADDDLTKARVYKQKAVQQASSIKERGNIKYDFWSKTETYKPTRQTTWLTPKQVKTFKTQLKPQASVTTRITPTTQTFRQSILKQIQQGKQSFRKYTFKQASGEARFTSPTPLRATTQLKPFTKGSLYKPKPISSSIIKAKPSAWKDMLSKGYAYKKPTSFILKDSKMAKFYGSADDLVKGTSEWYNPPPKGWVKGPTTQADEFVKGFGKSDFIQSPKFYGGKITTVSAKQSRKLLDDISAQATLAPPKTKLTYRTPLSKSTYKRMTSYKPTTTITIPTKPISLTVPLTALSRATQSTQTQKLVPQYQVSQKPIKVPQIRYKPISVQKQPQVQAQVFKPATKSLKVPRTTTQQTTITIPVEKTPQTTASYTSYYTRPFKMKTPAIYKPPSEKKKKKFQPTVKVPYSEIYGERTFKIYTPKKVKL